MDTVFPVVGLCVLVLAVAQILRLLVAAARRAVRAWRVVARHAARARNAERAACCAREHIASGCDAGARDVMRVVRGQTGLDASASSSLRRTSS